MKKLLGITLGITLLALTAAWTIKAVLPHEKPLAIRPIAEYEPTEAIMISELLFNSKYNGLAFARAILESNARLIILLQAPLPYQDHNNWIISKGFSEKESQKIELLNVLHDGLWLRDFGPYPLEVTFEVEPPQKLLKMLAWGDLKYKYADDLGDTLAYQLGIFLNSSILHIPQVLDGGNFLAGEAGCFLASDFLSNKDSLAPHEMASYLKKLWGCKEVYFLQESPHEHIDMFMKLIDAHNAIISTVHEKTLQHLRSEGQLSALSQMQALNEKMNAVKKQLANVIQLHEVAQPVPFRGKYLNYTNSVLINGVALIPRFSPKTRQSEMVPDASLYGDYETGAREVYQKLGYTVKFIDADALIEDGGALHCATIVLPRTQPRGAAQSVTKMGN